MSAKRVKNSSKTPAGFQRIPTTQKYVLVLYVTGATPRSTQAIESIRAICEQHLAGRYDLKVIDIYQQPELAKVAQIIAVPTLIKSLPPPLRRIIGDMSNTERVLLGLDLQTELPQ